MSPRRKKKKYDVTPEVATFYIIPYRKDGKIYHAPKINISNKNILRLGWKSGTRLEVSISKDKMTLKPIK
jgi:hypothetical protein